MDRTVHIIHGIHVSEPMESVGLIGRYFTDSGYRIRVHDYGHIFAWQARWKNDDVVREIKPHIKDGDIVVGHSNGCAIAWLLAEEGAPFSGAVLLNAALDTDAKFADHVDWVHVYHNEGDGVVSLSRILLWHPWGSMGRDGYKGNDPRVTNIDCYPEVDGHSDILSKLDVWGPKIVERVASSK